MNYAKINFTKVGMQNLIILMNALKTNEKS